LFGLIDGVLGSVTAAQTEATLQMLAPGPTDAQQYRDAFGSASAEQN